MKTQSRRASLLLVILAIFCFPIDIGADFNAPKPLGDKTYMEDLIVQGNSCVGLDCVDAEAFGLDLLRLKEDNIRIHFEDVSTIPGFPSNDWRILINETFSGGLGFFAIQDATGNSELFRLSAGAPPNSIFLNPSGKLGIGTNNPSERLTVNGDLSASGTVTPSDRRLKKDIQPFSDGLEVIRKMNPVQFKYTEESGILSKYSHLGLIAQDLLSYAPYLVRQNENENDEDHYLAIADSEIKYLLVNAIKDQQSQIEALRNQVKTLKVERDELSGNLASIEERLQKIESKGRLEN